MDPEQRARGKKELQLHGPRPAPLKISRDSHKIRKPAVPLPNRSQPVIIYTESPKIIHIEAHEFMTLVQRLTGSSSSEGPDLNDDKREDLEEKIAEESSSADYGPRSSANFDMNEKLHEKQEEAAKFENKADYETLKLQSPPLFSPLSPNFFLPSPHLLSPNIFQDLPLFTPNFDSFFYSPGHFYRLSEPFTPPLRTPPATIISPPATANTHPQY